MSRTELNQRQWRQIVESLPPTLRVRAHRKAGAYRRFVENVIEMSCGHQRWDEIDCVGGKWRAVYMRFLRWRELGVWDRVALALRDSPELSDPLGRYLDEHKRAAKRRARNASDADTDADADGPAKVRRRATAGAGAECKAP